MAKYFGTDGIRGVAGKELTPTMAYRVGLATAEVLASPQARDVYIGKDTRKSGDMLEAALIAGLTSGGLDVYTLGVVPTPAVAYLTKNSDACAGVVISASHNPGEYNGIKLFGGDGYKLPDDVELEIESHIDHPADREPLTGKAIGSVYPMPDAVDRYKDFLKSSISKSLLGVTVALDCGHGANSNIAPQVFEELGAKVIVTNREPDGMNINDNCGSTNPGIIQKLVTKSNSHCGFSFDGDGDRVIAVDDKGEIMDGDHILAAVSRYMKKKGELNGNGIVGTVMTNIGLDQFCKNEGIAIYKSKVGDRYVLEDMKRLGYVLGGEQSGHIIFLSHNTTGDGLLTALKLVEISLLDQKPMSQMNGLMHSYPQVLINARVAADKKNNYVDDIAIQDAITVLEESYHGAGRVLIRPSGTEPLVRVMLEGDDLERMEQDAQTLAKLIEERFGQ